ASSVWVRPRFLRQNTRGVGALSRVSTSSEVSSSSRPSARSRARVTATATSCSSSYSSRAITTSSSPPGVRKMWGLFIYDGLNCRFHLAGRYREFPVLRHLRERSRGNRQLEDDDLLCSS